MVERYLHRAAVTRRFDPVLAPEHVDELAPEARPADAVQQEVDGVVGIGEQVKDDPHHAQSAFGNGSRVLAQRVRDDEIDGDRRRRHKEAECDSDENGRHRCHLHEVAVRVQAAAAQVVRVEHAQ